MKITKATQAEKEAYAKTKPVYPLFGWLMFDGERLAVEYLGGHWSKDEPQYEAIAPQGKFFDSHDTHTVLGLSQKDLCGRLGYGKLASCDDPDHKCMR
jgi:hypothetical protein